MGLDVIQNRYSVRHFKEEMPSDDKINAVLEAGRLAPSWINVQPWHNIIIKDKETINLMGQLSNGQKHVQNALLIIACCGDLSAWEKANFRKTVEAKAGLTPEKIDFLVNSPMYNPGERSVDAVLYRTIEQVTYSVAYMTLEAQNQGLGACIIGAIGNKLTGELENVSAKVKQKLNLPDNMEIINLLVLGYPDDSKAPPKKARKDFNQVVSHEKYKNQ